MINIKDFKIELFNCKNKDINENISFADFEQSQLIDESKIKCDICNNSNKSEIAEELAEATGNDIPTLQEVPSAVPLTTESAVIF